MTESFTRHGERVRMRLEDVEVELLRSMQQALRETLESGEPTDAVVRRLFPPTVVADEEADEQLRAMLRDDLLTGRLRGLDALVELLDRGRWRGSTLQVELEDDEAQLVLGVLNDLRLAIGARIDIENLDREGVDPEDPVTYRLAVMDHFAWLQECLLRVLDPPSVRVHEEGEP